MSIKEIHFLSGLSFQVILKPWLLLLITSVCPWLHFLAAQFGVEWSAQEWAILAPWKSPYKQLSTVVPFVPFRIHSESLAVKKKSHIFSVILSCLIVSRDSDWYFHLVSDEHFLPVEVLMTSGVLLGILLECHAPDFYLWITFFPCTCSGQVKKQCRSSSLLTHIFVTCDNKIPFVGFIPSPAFVLWKAVNGCWKHALFYTDNLNRLLMLDCAFDLWMILQLVFFL